MQLRLIAIVFAISYWSAVASAADVYYQYVAEDENVDAAADNIGDPNVAIVDRAWLVPGMEQSDEYSMESFSTGRLRRETHVEPIVLLRHRDNEMSSIAQDPIWSKNDLWPRTQQMWQRGEYYRQFRLENPEPIYFTGLQR